MKTFNGSKKQKKELLNKLQHHQDLDAFIQGTWIDVDLGKIEGNGFKGCFYGCTMQTFKNAIEKFSEKYNIDLWYCHLTEKIFEGLPKGEYEIFPYKSIEILPLNINFNKVKSLFHYRVLENQLKFVSRGSDQEKSIIQCMNLFKVPFNEIDRSAAKSAVKSAAWSAAESAAWSAAESAKSAAKSAWSAAKSAESAAKSAAWSAAKSAAWSAAWSAESAWSAAESAYYIFLKDTLFNCIKEFY